MPSLVSRIRDLRRTTIVTISSVCVLAAGCDTGPAGKAHVPVGRVLIIGIDGASSRVVGPMLRDGRLPNLAAIAKEGVHGHILSSYLPLLSPRVWTTVATGKDATQHGIHSWVRETSDESLARLNYSYDRESHALWNILSSRGKTVGIVNWLTTYPPEVVRGVMVSSHTFPAEVEGKVFLGTMFAGVNGSKLEPVKRGSARNSVIYPEEWTDRVLDERHAEVTLTEFTNPFLGDDSIAVETFGQETMSRWYDTDERFVSIAREIQDELNPDLTMVLLQGIDRVCHALWAGVENPRAYPPETRWPPEKIAKARVAVETYYQYSDALIGKLLEGVGPDDLVIVLSDHGFEAPKPGTKVGTGSHHSEASRQGVFFARGRGIRAGAGTRGLTIKDVTPTVLAWLGIPVGDDMDGIPADFLEVDPLPSIATHDTTEILRVEGVVGTDEAMLKELQSLGYIE
jgi:predicted AlkP superfamily phosphohydrolase/phosphomutase